MEGLDSSSVSLHPFPDCVDLGARLYKKVVDGIDERQIGLLLDNLDGQLLTEK